MALRVTQILVHARFDKIISALLDWGDEIFVSHDTDRASNGRLEGTNNIGLLR